jgi:hypothetical protein
MSDARRDTRIDERALFDFEVATAHDARDDTKL